MVERLESEDDIGEESQSKDSLMSDMNAVKEQLTQAKAQIKLERKYCIYCYQEAGTCGESGFTKNFREHARGEL